MALAAALTSLLALALNPTTMPARVQAALGDAGPLNALLALLVR